VWGSVLSVDIGAVASHVIRDPCRCPLTLLASIASDFTLACYWPWALPPCSPQREASQKPGDVGRDNDIVPKSLRGEILWRFSVGDALTVDRIDGIPHPDPSKFSSETAFLTPSHLRLPTEVQSIEKFLFLRWKKRIPRSSTSTIGRPR
jgi:hypothetical protein